MTSFPQFSKLPIELRLKIWAFALEPRYLRIHLHKSYPMWLNDEQRYEGYAPAWPEHSSLTEPFNGPEYIPMTREEGGELYGYPDSQSDPRPCGIILTPCANTHPCGCTYFPPSSTHAQPLPGSLFACCESRDASMGQYIRCMEEEYDTRGLVVVHPSSQLVKSPPSTLLPRTGMVINPSLDMLVLRANVASRSGVQEVHHLASILSVQLPDIGKVVIQLGIAMPPYKFWQSNRFQYWRKWGEDGWWVPMRFLVKLRGLKEVVLVCNLKEKMLPLEWRTRTESQWMEEFLKLEKGWPAEWKGKMPSLKFVGDVANA
ncbi:hypothetical protein N431DRAFT_428204 [Stipitochalara longipes BDJ]|nr:hypothetical protein N431DRAFT_428204 [Stipitochalara longipes BDJ]